MRYLYETLCRCTPAFVLSSKLFMICGHDPLFVRPFFATEGECGDVESLAKVDWITHNRLACLVVSFQALKDGGSSILGPHNVAEF